uniref:Uncharacterized protein n=1 Tax=Periophthalmus magnuspinnatus TaxID=409849 RepID=A0A3B3ZFK8_9GOBI
MHSDPDYSAAYVVINTDCNVKRFGLTFTLGKGTGGTSDFSAVLNAVWDPLWKLPVDMIVSCIDFRYITDALTEDEALDILMKAQEEKMLKEDYLAYTTSCAWQGYPGKNLKQLCTDALQSSWTKFKVEVGANLEDDKCHCHLIREMTGPENTLVRCQRPTIRIKESKQLSGIVSCGSPLGIGVATGGGQI